MHDDLHPLRRKLLHTLAVVAASGALGLWSTAHAASLGSKAAITLPQGLMVTSPAKLDIVFQVIPSYDPAEKVLARWSGDKLQYVITVARLPAGWVQPNKYFKNLQEDMSAASVSVRPGRSGKYATKGRLKASYIERRIKLPDSAAGFTQVSHFLTDGKNSFVANATLMDSSATERMLSESIELLKTAAVAPEGATTSSAQ